MQYLFQHPMPVPWLLADILTILVTLLVGIFIVRKSKHPVVAMLECFGFVFLYASIYENFAVVQGWYVYGRSLLMVGDVPLSVPLIEMDVLVTGLWLLEKMADTRLGANPLSWDCLGCCRIFPWTLLP